jgi:hypothetical protein
MVRGDDVMTGESFVSRWSRLKQQQKTGQDPAAEETEQQPLLAEQQRDIHQLTDSDMPPIESLDESSDYSVFLSEKVSESLRQAALRKMFHFPALNVVDGLDDYAEDFSHFEPLGDILTQDMRRLAKREAEVVEARGIAEAEEADNSGADAMEVSDMEPGPEDEPGLGDGDVDDG